MPCKYEYKGRMFGSIDALDDFLLARQRFEGKYGDAVFSTVIPMGVFDTLVERGNRGFEIFKMKDHIRMRRMVRDSNMLSDDPYNASDYEYAESFIGVTSAIGAMRGINGDRLVPEAVMSNYFNKLKLDAANGNFSKDTGSFFSEEDVRMIFGYDENGVPNNPEPIPESEFKTRVQDVLEAKWKFQADAGNAIHDVLQAYFIGIGKWNGKTYPIRKIKDKDVRKKELLRVVRGSGGYFNTVGYFDNDNKERMKSQRVKAVSESVLTDEMVYSLFEVAENAYESIKGEFGVNANGNEEFEMFAEYPVFDDEVVDIEHYDKKVKEKKRLSGSIDLMVVDKNGTPHIIDWKTSPKPYNGYNDVKKRTYRYQLGLYRQILNRMGINTDDTRLYIAPVRISGITRDSDGKYSLTGISVDKNSDSLKNITTDVSSDNGVIMDNINSILRGSSTYIPKNEDVIEATNKEIKTILPEHSYGWENLSDDYIHNQFKTYCAINKQTGKYNYYKNQEHKGRGREIGGKVIEAATPEEMYDKIRMYHTNKPERRREQVRSIRSALIDILNKNMDAEINVGKTSQEYLRKVLGKYMNGRWRVVTDIPAAQEYGIIILKNVYTGRVDILNITNENLNDMHPTKQGSELISGYLHDDIIEKAKKSRMLTSIEGNLELIKTLSFLNNLEGYFDPNRSYIGEIIAINANDGESIHAHGDDLKYTYNTLMNAHKNDGVSIRRGIRFGDVMSVIEDDLFEIQEDIDKRSGEWNAMTQKQRDASEKPNILRKFHDTVVYSTSDAHSLSAHIGSTLETKIRTVGEKRNALIRLQKDLESKFKFLNEIKPDSDIDSSNRDIYELYIDISKAISELSGVQLKQQLFESNPWMQFGFTQILKKGYTGTSMDNPGMMYSDLLNDTTGYVGNAYQNIRDRLAGPISKFTELEERMVKAIGANRITMAVKSREDIWKEFYVKDADGEISEDFIFMRPEDVAKYDKEKADILNDLLMEINRMRLMSDENIPSDEQVEDFKDDERYYYVPILKRGYTDTNGTVHNTSDTLVAKLKKALPNIVSVEYWKKAVPEAKEKFKGFFGPSVDEDTRAKKESNDLYSISKELLGEGDIEDRRKKIREIGMENISTNAANAAMTLAFSRISTFELDNALTLMKCSILNLKYEGDLMNRKYDKDIEYLQNYIRKNIKSADINDPKLHGLSAAIDKLSNIAVMATLGFSPIQAIYQPLQGLFSNSALVAKRVLGDRSFGFKEFEQGMKIAYGDIVDEKRSKLAILNQIFGINDMDMNDYINKANDHKDIATISGLRKIAMMFASRPDYYNRMSIFVAQMIKDGTWEAYEKVGNELVYDFKKDKRFSKLNDPNAVKDEEYYKQLGEYTAMAKQLVVEGARILHGPDAGKRFKYVEGQIIPLPKAYTNQQSEAYKNIADDIYGYYSHEKKAMVHALFLGKLFMQFKTYFSGKKNQYFMPGGVRMRGSYQQAVTDDGKKIYTYQRDDGYDGYAILNDDGTFADLDSGNAVDSSKAIPFYMWKGQYQEGVAITLAKLLTEVVHNGKSWKDAIAMYTENPDETVRNAYITNRNQLISDIIISLLVGAIIARLLMAMYNDMKGDDSIPTIAKDSTYILARAVTNASLDANILSTVSGVTTEWTPLTITWTKKAAENIAGVLSGDKNVFKALQNSVSAVGQVKNTFSQLYD